MKDKIIFKIKENCDKTFFNIIAKYKNNIHKSYCKNGYIFFVVDKDIYSKFIMFENITKEETKINKIILALNKYKIIIISLVLSLLLIFLSSFFIVDINIIHEDEAIVELLKNELESHGIFKYQLKKSYHDLQNIKTQIKNDNLDMIEWLEIDVIGMKYVVKAEKRIITRPIKKNDYCHVVAKSNGIIKSLQVYDGQSVVEVNDYVKKGDIIISGEIKRNEDIVDHKCANGSVKAEKWYNVSVTVPFDYKENKKTKKIRYNIILNYDGVDYKIFKSRLKNYDSRKREIFNLLGVKIYLEKDREIIKINKKYNEKQATKEALRQAKEKVITKIGSKDKILEQKVLQKWVKNSTIYIDIFIITEEEIGYQKVSKESTINDI